ncbi:MAG: methyltransferase domain-containing protein [Eubacteriales bacterium]|nr:methyltransferase domain-containing protein [Eubacteriales bacterium]
MINKKNNKNVCLVCGSELGSEPLVRFWNMPESAQGLPKKEELSNDKGINLDLYTCKHCGLVQFDCEPVDYYKDVIRAVGLSETMKELRRNDYRHMIEKYGLSEGKWIECGCGNGDFLAVLREFPVNIYGTEANKENALIAEKKLKDIADNMYSSGEKWVKNYDNKIFNIFPDREDIDIDGGNFDCFLSFNFLEHQPDPVSMLKCMHHNLREGGYGIISVPSFEYILKDGNYYELIRDHIANYSMESLRFLCEYCGFSVLEEKYIGIGDTIVCVVRKVKEEMKPEIDNTAFSDIDEEIRAVFKKKYELKTSEMKNYIDELRKEGRKLALWGAGHQGLTIAATTELSGYASYIIDSASFKQGRYAPASHIPIVGPEHYLEHPVDVIMIAAPGYVKEIEKNIREIYKDFTELKICDVLNLNER